MITAAPEVSSPRPRSQRPACAPGCARNHFLAFAACLLLALIFTLPGSLHPASALLGDSGDNFQHAWFLWHFAQAFSHGQNPFYTRLLYYPNTVNLAWSTTDPLAAAIALPVSLTLGPAVAYNLSLILQLALAAFFARLLCLRICHNEAAALAGGICFGFSPFLLAHALGHLSLVTAFPVPLYFLALDRVLRNSQSRMKDGIFLGLALLLTAFAHYNYTVICLLATLAIILIDAILSSPALLRRIWRPLAVASATFLIFFSPILFMLVGSAHDIPQPRPFDHIRQYSADVFGFLIPGWNHVLFGKFSHSLNLRLFVAGYEGTVYVGPVIASLAVLGFWKGRAEHRRWVTLAALLAAIFYLLSLGPALRFFGWQTSIPGPAALLYRIPFASFVSAPARFHVITALSLSILTSLGVAAFLERFPSRWQRYSLLAAVFFFLLLDLLTIPFPLSSIADPAWSADSLAPPRACALPSALQQGTIVTFPLIHWPYSLKSMWMQVSDGGRYALVDGYLSYSSDRVWSAYYRNPLLRSLLSIQGESHAPVDPETDRATVPAALRDLDASAVVVFDSPQHDAAVRYLNSLLGEPGEPYGSCTIFATPDADAAPRQRP